MERKEFLKKASMAGVLSLLPFGKSIASNGNAKETSTCALVPSETAGPYPLNLSSNVAMFRTDIRETQPGVDFRFRMRIIGLNNCLPIPNCRVDVWHCSPDGYYSGYTTTGHL